MGKNVEGCSCDILTGRALIKILVLSHNLYVGAEDNMKSLRFDSQIIVEKMKAGPPDCKIRKHAAQSRAQSRLDNVKLT